METRFGHDFSQVRVHTDARAAESARAVNANAYTVGSNVVFGEGRYAPRSVAGRRLVAHELAHVVQQRGVEPDSDLGVVDDAYLEHQASAAAAASAGGAARVAGSAARGVQRQAEELTQVWRVGPIDALRARADARRALADARRSGLPGLHNGPADAWRHCHWNCLLTHSIGEDQAREVADTHEEFGSNPANETTMDLHNNGVGRGCGLATRNCWGCCMDRLSLAGLLIIPDYAGVASLPPVPSGGIAGSKAPPGEGRGEWYYGGPDYYGPGYYRRGKKSGDYY
jgi:hypothetical protein